MIALFHEYTTPDELKKISPTASKILNELTSEIVDLDGASLKTISHKLDLDLHTLLRILTAAANASTDQPTVTLELMPAGDLCNHLQSRHEACIEYEVAHLDGLSRLAVARLGNDLHQVHEIRTAFERFQGRITNHIRQETEEFFPLIRTLSSPDPSTGNGRAYAILKNPAARMELQHQEVEEALSDLQELVERTWAESGHSETPPLVHALQHSIRALSYSLHEQIYKESRFLFPQALGMAG